MHRDLKDRFCISVVLEVNPRPNRLPLKAQAISYLRVLSPTRDAHSRVATDEGTPQQR